MKKEIENHWCIYNFLEQTGIGIIYEEGKNCLIVQHSENGPYAPWNPDCIKRFSTATEAIQDYQKTKLKPYSLEKTLTNEEVLNIVKEKFPSYFNGKS